MAVPVANTDIASELFSQLLEFKWRDVSLPTTTFELSLKQTLAEHKYPDKDGANIEATGREPLEISARIPFRNGAVPAKSESWGILYPDQWRKFLAAAADKSDGVLQHPELGAIICKLVSFKTVWAADVRDGVDVDCVWMETISTDTAAEFLAPTPITTATLGATDLDANIGDAGPLLPQTPAFKPSFADTMRSIQAIGDTVSGIKYSIAGQVNSLQFRAQLVEQSVNRAGQPVTLWPLRQNAIRVQDGLSNLRQTLLQSKRKVGLYPVKVDQTLASVAQAAGAAIEDVINLNPSLLRNPIVLAGTYVRFYV